MPDPTANGAANGRTLTYGQALNEALREEMLRDPLVFLMGEDVATWGQGGTFGVSRGLAAEFGTERIRNTPISEAGMAGLESRSSCTGTV